MSGINLHIFNDPVGFFSGKTVDFINAIQPGQNRYINIAGGCSNRRTEISYGSIAAFLKNDRAAEEVRTIIFHSYSYFNQRDLKRIRARYASGHIKLVWIFWSHEYYQLPEFFSELYRGFSRRFYLRKILSFHAGQLLLFLKGQAASPVYLGLRSFKKSFRHFNQFCAFLEGDFETVMKGVPDVHFLFSAYLSVNDFPKMETDFNLPKNEVMIGHCGSPILNHYEIVQSLSHMNWSSRVIIPLSYGKAAYIKRLTAALKKINNLDLLLQTAYLKKEEYYKSIDQVGYFILNSACQQALGNIVFFLWNGVKVFVQKSTSTYATLAARGYYIYSIEEHLNAEGLQPLTYEQKRHNHRLMLEQLNEPHVAQSWLRILSSNS